MSAVLFIRTDAGTRIGAGHAVRCLAVARELRKRGEESVFLTASEEAAGFIRKDGFPAEALPRGAVENAKSFAEFAAQRGVTKLLFDFPDASPCFSQALGAGIKLIYLGSKEEFFPGVRLLVNYSNALNADFYQKTYRTEKTVLLLGARYAPLRREFQSVHTDIQGTAGNILISAGGSDEFSFAFRLADRLSGCFPSLRFTVLSGRLNAGVPGALSADGDRISVLRSPPDVAAVMRTCAAAVSAAGTTLYELCACGVPTVCFSFTPEQAKSGARFGTDGIADYAGDLAADFDACAETIRVCLARLTEDEALRGERSRKMRAYVDGFGSRRIANEILRL